MFIDSVNNKKIKYIKKLNTKKYRDVYNEFIIEGEHLVQEAFKNEVLKEIIISKDFDLNINVPKVYVSDKVLKYISNMDNPPKVIGLCKKIECEKIGSKILILDGVQDPGNLGTIIRSCAAFNFDTLVLSNDCVDIYNTKVLRATQGMIFNINILQLDIEDFITKVKNEGYKVFSTRVDNGKSINEIKITDKFAIVMGSEGSGVRDNIINLCDEFVYIKMNKNCESLNVGVAASIILYELNK